MKLYRKLLLVIVIISSTSLWSQSKIQKYHYQMPLNCSECHSCDKPTHKDPCLIVCPDFKREGLTLQNTAEEAPELITIDKLARVYEPSIFTHKLHAEMSEMSGGCITCHHYNPPGKVLACIECHEPSKKRTDISKPGLTGAYHQQCLSCHREWSHKTNCTVCHAEKGSVHTSDKSEFAGKSHSRIEMPKKLVYQTEEEDNPVVTFFHTAHVEVYGTKCTDCHQDESCSRCHDMVKKQEIAEKESHENCIKCHEKEIDNKCERCHDSKERPPFTHERVGWKLKKYHATQNCQVCHNETKSAKLSKKCATCHKNWESGSFDHGTTGLVLDDEHIDLDCSDCHINSNFGKKPSCDDCHEDNFYPKMKPGELK